MATKAWMQFWWVILTFRPYMWLRFGSPGDLYWSHWCLLSNSSCLHDILVSSISLPRKGCHATGTPYKIQMNSNKCIFSSEKGQKVFTLVGNALPSLHPCLCHPLPTRLCQERKFKTNLHRLYSPSCSTTLDRPWDSSSLLVRLCGLNTDKSIVCYFRLARNDPASNTSELACDANTLINGTSVTSERNLQQCQASTESSSHNFAHGNAPTLSHDPEDPLTYSEAVAAPWVVLKCILDSKYFQVKSYTVGLILPPLNFHLCDINWFKKYILHLFQSDLNVQPL